MGDLHQVVVLGLDSAGKTTLLSRLLLGRVSLHRIQCGKSRPGQEDVSDHMGSRGTEEHETQLEECKALVFVVDSSDPGRLPEAQKALKKVLSEEQLREVPLMILANKNDLPNSMTIEEISTKLNLNNYTDRSWEIQACSAQTGLGIQQAFTSVHRLIKKG